MPRYAVPPPHPRVRHATPRHATQRRHATLCLCRHRAHGCGMPRHAPPPCHARRPSCAPHHCTYPLRLGLPSCPAATGGLRGTRRSRAVRYDKVTLAAAAAPPGGVRRGGACKQWACAHVGTVATHRGATVRCRALGALGPCHVAACGRHGGRRGGCCGAHGGSVLFSCAWRDSGTGTHVSCACVRLFAPAGRQPRTTLHAGGLSDASGLLLY